MSRRLIIFLISVLSLFFIVSLSRSIYSLWQKRSLVQERQVVRDQLTKENQALQKKLSEAESQEFIEREAREKLNLQKVGEVVVILPQDLRSSPTAVPAAPPEPPWKQWWKLFF